MKQNHTVVHENGWMDKMLMHYDNINKDTQIYQFSIHIIDIFDSSLFLNISKRLICEVCNFSCICENMSEL